MREFWKSVNIGRGYKQECSDYDVWLMPHYHIRVGNRRNVSARDRRYCRRLLRENKIETRENRLKNLSSDGRMPMLIQVWRTSRLGIGVGGRAHIVKYRREPSVRRHATKSSSHRPSDRRWRLVPAATTTWRYDTRQPPPFAVDSALIVARNRFHYRFYVFSDLTSIAARRRRHGAWVRGAGPPWIVSL